jgi:hypothetical protein
MRGRSLFAATALLALATSVQARPITIVTPSNTADAQQAKTIIEDKMRTKGFLLAEAADNSLYILIDAIHHRTKAGEEVGMVGTLVIATPGKGPMSAMAQSCMQDKRMAQLMKDTNLMILDCTSAISLDEKALAKVMADFAMLSLRNELPATTTPAEKADAGLTTRKPRS